MKNLANYISLSRILFSILLVFTEALSPLFFIIFMFCGFTDIVDGYIARSYALTSDFGAKLDSIADIVFFMAYLLVLLPVLCYDYLISLWIIVIFIIKSLSITIGYIRFGKFALIHTYLNKLTGLLLVLLPFILVLGSSGLSIVFVCLVASVASIEELLIIIRSQKLALDCKSIFKFI
ncbi:MAG: hypothetical protein BZ136_04990 [Methanosphaera sp. rholeuAM74]|nr:MAG: hypothetical protein BZ136_04990 [Methanosphaera sp. rholeuAM74]